CRWPSSLLGSFLRTSDRELRRRTCARAFLSPDVPDLPDEPDVPVSHFTFTTTSIARPLRRRFETGHLPSASRAIFSNAAASMPVNPSAVSSSFELVILMPASPLSAVTVHL